MPHDTDDENLPMFQGEEVDLSCIKQPEVPELPHNAAITTVRKNDMEIATMGLLVVREMWKHATSFSRVMRLQKETRDAVKFRREVMGLPYGSDGKQSREIDLTPID